jgi:hypothetical protein
VASPLLEFLTIRAAETHVVETDSMLVGPVIGRWRLWDVCRPSAVLPSWKTSWWKLPVSSQVPHCGALKRYSDRAAA